jgi:hypothetical protein
LFTFPATGDYYLRLRDVQGMGGEEYAYRLTIAPPQPDFALRVSPDNLRVLPGETAMLTVNALRLDGFSDAIPLRLVDLPKGFAASKAVVPAGQNQVALTITAPAAATAGVFAPRILGAATIGGRAAVREAEAAETVMQAFSWVQVVPVREYSLTVLPPAPPPFRLALDLSPGKTIEVAQGGETRLTLRLTRRGDVKGPVVVTAAAAPPGVSVKPTPIPIDKQEVTITIAAAPRAPVGTDLNLILRGTLRSGKLVATGILPAVAIAVRGGNRDDKKPSAANSRRGDPDRKPGAPVRPVR